MVEVDIRPFSLLRPAVGAPRKGFSCRLNAKELWASRSRPSSFKMRWFGRVAPSDRRSRRGVLTHRPPFLLRVNAPFDEQIVGLQLSLRLDDAAKCRRAPIWAYQ